MIVDTITEAKARFSSLIELVQQGEEVIIKKAGLPVAVIRPYERPHTECRPGALAGRVKLATDFDTLPPGILEAFGING